MKTIKTVINVSDPIDIDSTWIMVDNEFMKVTKVERQNITLPNGEQIIAPMSIEVRRVVITKSK